MEHACGAKPPKALAACQCLYIAICLGDGDGGIASFSLAIRVGAVKKIFGSIIAFCLPIGGSCNTPRSYFQFVFIFIISMEESLEGIYESCSLRTESVGML